MDEPVEKEKCRLTTIFSPDVPVNPCRDKKLSNMRSTGDGNGISLSLPLTMSLERAFEYIAPDELPGVRSLPSWIVLLVSFGLFVADIGNAAPPAEVKRPWITADEFIRKVQQGERVEAATVSASWFRQLYRGRDEKAAPLIVKLGDCTISGALNCGIDFPAYGMDWRKVKVEGDVAVQVNKGTDSAFLWQEVTVEGEVVCSLNATAGGLKRSISWKGVTVSRDVQLMGPSGHTSIDFDHVTLGNDFILTGFNDGDAAFAWNHGEVAGNVTISDNNPDGNILGGRRYRLADLKPNQSEFGLWWRGVKTAGTTLISQSDFYLLDFDFDGEAGSRASEMVGRATFQNVRARRAHFTHTAFHQEVRWIGCELGELWLDEAVFEKDVSFLHTTIAPPRLARDHLNQTMSLPEDYLDRRGGVSFEETRFEGKLRLPWRMVEESSLLALFSPMTAPCNITGWRLTDDADSSWRDADPAPVSQRTWEALHEAVKGGSDANAIEETEYRGRLLDGLSAESSTPRTVAERTRQGWERFCCYLSLWTYGFGHRPARTLLWIAFIILSCACAFASQVPRQAVRPEFDWDGEDLYLRQTRHRRSAWRRLRLGLDFSLRAAWKWSYGWEQTRTWSWRCLAVGEQVAVKVLLFLCAKALANTSPLLKEITDKLLPFG